APKGPHGHANRRPPDRPLRPSASYRSFRIRWQRKAEGRSPVLVRSRPETPAMHFDDRTANRQAHAHAVLFRGEEGFKDPLRILEPNAAILYLNQHGIRALLMRSE